VQSRELQAQAQQALESSPEAVVVTAGSLASAMDEEARQRGVEGIELACTLIVAALAPAAADAEQPAVRAVLWQLGDSSFGLVRNGAFEFLAPVTEEDDALISTGTDALPVVLSARRWVVDLQSGDTLVLMTDGVANTAMATPDYRDDLALMWADGAPSPSALLEVVDASVKSFGDDRTFVGIRVG
jgi:hypothetical protein